MTTAEERAFAFFLRGEVREDLLTNWRLGLASLVDPETGAFFTQDKIAQATQQGSRWWIEADAIDQIGMAIQSRAMFLADQLALSRANHNFLVNYHGELYGLSPLPASGGTGPVTTTATPGATYVGSVTLGDPAATTFRDAAGLRYQVLTTVVTGGGGIASLTLIAIDTGDATNLKVDDILNIDQNPPIGATATATVTADFTGGLPDETDADFQGRMRANVRHKPGAGNSPQVRAWARQASNAVLDGYIYPCAMHAGSTLVCITQKRGKTVGPNAQVASAGLLATVTAYLVPPASPVVPPRAFFAVVTFTPEPTNIVLQLSQMKATAGGWTSPAPWPGITSVVSSITALTNQTHFSIHSDTTLPGGVGSLTGPNCPPLMVWNDVTSRFEKLQMTSVTSSGGGVYAVVLSVAPAKTLAIGDYISPDMARRDALAVAAEQYMDDLGPGEVIDLVNDPRGDRAARFPDPNEESSLRAGQPIVTWVSDALGATLTVGTLFSMSVTVPALPSDVINGPSKLTLGKLAVYDL